MAALHITTKDLLLFYFNGELDNKIQRYESKIRKKWPDSYYNTLDSVKYRYMKSDTNNIGDPTGGTATELADLSLQNKKIYEKLLAAKKAIIKVIRSLNLSDINNLKLYLKKNKRKAAARSIISEFRKEIRKQKKLYHRKPQKAHIKV